MVFLAEDWYVASRGVKKNHILSVFCLKSLHTSELVDDSARENKETTDVIHRGIII